MEPWEHEAFNGKTKRNGRWRNSHHSTRYETVQDSNRLASRKGDIIKFGSGYWEIPFGDWRDWFLKSRKEKLKLMTRNRNIPDYAMNQYAMIANRYRWIKYKYKTYTDYGAIVMMVTGNKPCHPRKFYMNRPYRMISAFPHKKLRSGNIHVRMKKPFRVVDNMWFLFDFNLSEFIETITQIHGDCEISRDMFLMKIKEVWGTNL